MRILNAFENKELIGKKNCLQLKSANSNYVSIPFTNAVDFGNSDFSITAIFNESNVAIQLQILNDDGSQILIADGVVRVKSNQGTTIDFLPDNFIKNSWVSVIIQRRSNNIELFINDHKIGSQSFPSTDTVNLFTGQVSYTTYPFGSRANLTADYVNGYLSRFAIIKGAAFTEEQVNYFLGTSIIPIAMHTYVAADYHFNEGYGNKAFDLIEQYNYAKVTALVPNHADLINYSSDELGVSNLALQSSRKDFYTLFKLSQSYLTWIGVEGYSEILGLNYPSLTGWALYMEFIAPKTGSGLQILFDNKSPSPDFIRVRIDSLNTLRLEIDSLDVATIPIEAGKRYKLLLNATSNTIDYILQGFNAQLRNYSSVNFSGFRFGYGLGGGYGFNGGIGKAVFFNRVLSDSEKQKIFISDKTDYYKYIPNLLLDLNFADVFLSSGNYYARDNSGNNYDSKIFNWIPSTDKSILFNSYSGFPKQKGLRFNSSLSHYLSVSNFNPTKELGYTVIVQSKLLNKAAAFEGILSKRSSKYYLLTYADNSMGGTKIAYATDFAGNFVTYDLKKILQLNSYSIAQNDNAGIVSANGNPVVSLGSTTIVGFDEITGVDFNIGLDNSSYVDGYISFVGVWKGVKSQREILNIIQSDFNPNNDDLLPNSELLLFFEGGYNDSGVIKIKDWSLQNRTVIMNNYTTNDIDSSHVDYKFVEVETLL